MAHFPLGMAPFFLVGEEGKSQQILMSAEFAASQKKHEHKYDLSSEQ